MDASSIPQSAPNGRNLSIAFIALMSWLAIGCSPVSLARPGADESHVSAAQPAEADANPDPVRGPAPAPRPSWPNWLGPDHDGVSHETGWQTTWPETGLPIRWTAEVGIGFSSVSIANGSLYTMGHRDGNEIVHCLDTDTGTPRWVQTYPGILVDNLHEGGPGATPTIEGEFVYTVGREGQLHCWDSTTGKPIWSRRLQEDLGVLMPEWGFSSSPYILQNQLILEAGCVVSYDKRTGEIHWKTEPHAAGYGSVCAFTYNSRTCLATLDCDGLRVLNASDGTQVAFTAWESRFGTNSTTPIVEGDKVFVSTGYDIGCGLLRLSTDGLELVYKNRKMRNHFNNSILLRGHLYGFDGNSNRGRVVQLTCMDFETGEIKWQQRGFGCGSLMIADEKLLVLSEDGTLVLANASPQGFEELARSPFLDGRCWTVPVLLDGRIYGRNAAGKLVCADVGSQP
ncbi:MAG: PQQ-binding-like beta-propeller repeat protein [Planctomycetota bacterium]|nr:PQQ-binding-like beta-propeller repeat protein [Planctomycetota bacterium]